MNMHRVLMVLVAAGVVVAASRPVNACNVTAKVRVAAAERRHVADAGDYVALLAAPKVKVPAQVRVFIEVPAERIEGLAPDALVELFDARGNVVAAGPVTVVSPKVDEATRTVVVGSIVDDSLGLLRAGRPLRARVVFHFGRAITVPEQAVWRDGGRSFVWVAQARGTDMVARRRAVTLGERLGDARVVRAGVAHGERVVVDGGRPLADGVVVLVEP
jgi:RND family efflux transporter MFP subunit